MTDPSNPSGPNAAPGYYRWLVLLACSLAIFGNYYVFDALYPVTTFMQQQLGMSGQQIGLMDTAYNVAALFGLFVGVIVIDRLGAVRSALLFASIGAAGSALIAFLPAAMPDSPEIAFIAGRFVLGIGAELFIVTATAVVGRWFKGKEVGFALAVQLLIARFGSVLADDSPKRFASFFTGWQPPLILAAGFGAAWLVFAILYAALEAHAAKRFGVKQAVATDKLVFADIMAFGRRYWWVVGLCVAFYATIFPFRSFANLYFTEAHGISEQHAGSLKAWLPIISMVGMPIFGIVADKIGKRALLMFIGSALLLPPFLLMPYTGAPLELSMGMLGVAFALVPAVLWPTVIYLVPETRLGSAYALMTFCQQLFWAGMSWGIGAAKDAAKASAQNPSGWLPVMAMLAGLSAAGLVFAFLFWRDEGKEESAPAASAATGQQA
ncbi:MAG: MFS transporter [Myxococcales bacterium]|jgi:nitrate/nitrite transporter NarK